MSDVRMPAVAGTFYPGDEKELKGMVTKYLEDAKPPELEGELKGLIVPHAGYIYSGPVAAYGYKLMKGQKRIILIGPSHHAYFEGICESGHAGWNTPLGIAKAFSMQLNAYPAAHQPEHSVEVQIPFLQVVLDDFEVDPILTGNVNPSEAADALENEDGFLLISSDLSHYLPYDVAVKRDDETIRLIESMDLKGFMEKGDACGKMGILIAMELAKRKGWKFQLLYYANSGDTAGPKTGVVGYAAIAIIGE